MDFENWKIKKSDLDAKLAEYAQVAEWCNEQGNFTITEDEEFYFVIKIDENGGEVEDVSI